MSRPRLDWTRTDHETAGAFIACSAVTGNDPADIRRALGGDERLAARVLFLRTGVAPELLAWWKAGHLSFQQMWACAGCSSRFERQREEAAERSPAVRRQLGSGQ